MPSVVGPDGLESDFERAQSLAHKIPEQIRAKLLCQSPVERRVINPVDPFNPDKRDPIQYIWFKALDKMPDDLAVNQYVLAYASDYAMISTALSPHGYTYWNRDMQVASLDHAMYFHRDFRMDQWLLHVIESPNANSARGLCQGKIFTQDGILVANTVQEGLIRLRNKN